MKENNIYFYDIKNKVLNDINTKKGNFRKYPARDKAIILQRVIMIGLLEAINHSNRIKKKILFCKQ